LRAFDVAATQGALFRAFAAVEFPATTQTLAAEIKGIMSLLARFETRLASYARPEASPLGLLRRLPERL
jgi:hypothetical protein